MGVATAFSVLGALIFIRGRLLRAVRDLVVQRVEENLDECVGVFALELVLAAFPATVFADVRTALRVVKE